MAHSKRRVIEPSRPARDLDDCYPPVDAGLPEDEVATLMNAACSTGNLKRVRQILEQYPEAPNFSSNVSHGWRTPLFNAMPGAHVDVIYLLLQRGADPNRRDNYGWMPLFKLLLDSNAYVKIPVTVPLKMLIDAGADVNAMSPPTGEGRNSALMNAINQSQVLAAEILVECGAQMGPDLLNFRASVRSQAFADSFLFHFSSSKERIP